MKSKKSESGVRLPVETLEKLRTYKEKKGINIGHFVNEAVLEKLKRDKK